MKSKILSLTLLVAAGLPLGAGTDPFGEATPTPAPAPALAVAVPEQEPAPAAAPAPAPLPPASAETPSPPASPEWPANRRPRPEAGIAPVPRPPLGEMPMMGGRFFRGQSSSAPESGGGVITFGALNQLAVDEMSEDLRVLGFILNNNLQRTLSDDSTVYRLGVPMLLESGGRSMEACYIEGFGAMFRVPMRIPLILDATQDAKGEAGRADSEWERARRAVQGQESGEQEGGNDSARGEAERFNPKLVEILKKRVIESLKFATNLRHLKPDEYVVVTLVGAANRGVARGGSFSSSAGGGGGGFAGGGGGGGGFAAGGQRPGAGGVGGSQGSAGASPYREGGQGPGAGSAAGVGEAGSSRQHMSAAMMERYGIRVSRMASPTRPTIMTIRMKKSDLDSLAAKRTSEEEFEHKAEVNTYFGAGGAGDEGQVRRF